MERVAFGGESCGKIWITFPVTCGVAVGQTRIAVRGAAVARVSTMRKWIAVGSTQCAGRLRIADEIAALACGIAPGTIWIPVPGSNAELGILPVGDWPPSGGERFPDRFRANCLAGRISSEAPSARSGSKGTALPGEISTRTVCAGEMLVNKSSAAKRIGLESSFMDRPWEGYCYDLILSKRLCGKSRYAQSEGLPSEITAPLSRVIFHRQPVRLQSSVFAWSPEDRNLAVRIPW